MSFDIEDIEKRFINKKNFIVENLITIFDFTYDNQKIASQCISINEEDSKVILVTIPNYENTSKRTNNKSSFYKDKGKEIDKVAEIIKITTDRNNSTPYSLEKVYISDKVFIKQKEKFTKGIKQGSRSLSITDNELLPDIFTIGIVKHKKKIIWNLEEDPTEAILENLGRTTGRSKKLRSTVTVEPVTPKDNIRAVANLNIINHEDRTLTTGVEKLANPPTILIVN